MNAQDYYKHFTAAWHLLKRFCDRHPKDDDFWHDFADSLREQEFTEMCKTQFGRDLVYAVKDEFERESKEQEANSNNQRAK